MPGAEPGGGLPPIPPAAAADSVRTPERSVPRTPSTFDQPRYVMLRSLLFPGWGQWHNHARAKAIVIGGIEGYLIGRAIHDQARLQDYQSTVDRAQAAGDEEGYATAVAAYNDLLDASVSRLWLLGGVVAYAMADAYVDAHFVDFDVQFRADPALPKGSPPAAKVRLGLRWRF